MSACPHCAAGHVRSRGDHFRISERGVERLGPCAAPDEHPGDAMKPDTFRARLDAVTERLRAPVVAAILAPTTPAPTHWTDEEEETDGD